MYEIDVREEFRAPIAKVFEALSDHERFFRGYGVKRSTVVTPGKTEKNGLGAVREIDAMGSLFREEVVRFERPTRFDYQIRKVTMFGRRLPMQHELGWLELSETGGVTKVVWRSRFTMTVPMIGDRLAKLVGPRTAKAFRGLMRQAKRELETDVASAS